MSTTIPGIGALYRINTDWRLLAGVHKGYNPPGPGSSADEESSLNIEAGARYDSGALRFEGIYFLNDYDNLVGTVTESTGGGGDIGDQPCTAVSPTEKSVTAMATDRGAAAPTPIRGRLPAPAEPRSDNVPGKCTVLTRTSGFSKVIAAHRCKGAGPWAPVRYFYKYLSHKHNLLPGSRSRLLATSISTQSNSANKSLRPLEL